MKSTDTIVSAPTNAHALRRRRWYPFALGAITLVALGLRLY